VNIIHFSEEIVNYMKSITLALMIASSLLLTLLWLGFFILKTQNKEQKAYNNLYYIVFFCFTIITILSLIFSVTYFIKKSGLSCQLE